jgi:large subunit ribosomal protein L2
MGKLSERNFTFKISRKLKYMPLLSTGIKSLSGRNALGRIIFFHRGSGQKRKYRLIDFWRSIKNIPAIVRYIFNDTNRTSSIALISYYNEVITYILAPLGLKAGQIVFMNDAKGGGITSSIFNKLLAVGFSSELNSFPINTMVHSIESKLGRGGQFMRAAGSAAQILRHIGGYTLCRLKSGEHRQFKNSVVASIGVPMLKASRLCSKFSPLRKAGLNRCLGRRPIVRGCAMNPVDHPHGGNTSSKFGSFTPWGKISKGVRTSKYKKINRLVILPRIRNSDRKK